MKRTIVLLSMLFAATSVQAQHDHDHDHVIYLEELGDGPHAPTGQTVSYADLAVAPRIGLTMQKNLFAEVGVSLDFFRLGYTEASEYVSFAYSNLRPWVSGEIMVGRELVGGGRAGVEYIMSTPLFGMAAGLDAAYYTDGARNAVALTPRLMLSLVKVEIFYGYNIFIRNELSRYVGPHRFGISMTLSPRFWRHKKEVYNDYYNSYIER